MIGTVKDNPSVLNIIIVFAAGLAGALGVVLAAIAAHLKPEQSILTASQMLIFHASAFLGLAAWSECDGIYRRRFHIAALILIAGVILFAGDLCLRAFYNFTPLHYAAPLGGALIILGWICVSIAAIFRVYK